MLEDKLQDDNKEVAVYEIGYLLIPTISEEELTVAYTELKNTIIDEGASIIIDDMPKMIDLSYMMSKVIQNVKSKFNNAYFGWIKFEINKKDILNIKKKFSLNPLILRFLVLKTVRENTIASKKFSHKDVYRRKTPLYKKEEEIPGAEINKEEIDKEIDALVAV